MKKLISFVLLFLPFSQIIQAYDSQVPVVEQVLNNEHEVLLLINKSWLTTEGFHVSDAGAFALVQGEWRTLSDACILGDYQAAWKCSKCNRYNMEGVNTCPYCGKKRNG